MSKSGIGRANPFARKSGIQTAEADTKGDDPGQPHLIPLADGQWALWRIIGLRGAGFPAAQVLKLSASECAARADQLSIAQFELHQARSEALAILRRDLHRANKADSAILEKRVKKIKQGKIPELSDEYPGQQEVLQKLSSASERVALIDADFRQSFDAALKKNSNEIREAVGAERFREAIIWQNRNAFHTGLKPLLRRSAQSASRGSKHRQHEELVANYLQRYCVKNDTIGFFGPVGWADFVSHGEAITVQPGPDLIASRAVYFEAWPIDAVAETLMKNKSLKPWIAPRCMPFIHLEQTVLHTPGARPMKLSHNEAAILHLCDGRQTAKELASRLLQQPALKFKSEQEVYNLLEHLVTIGAIAWSLEVPVEKESERTLRRLINRIGEERLRRPTLDILVQLEAARNAVANAAGDPELLDSALGDLEAKFSSLTGVASTRGEGKTYGARTLVYQDCRRDAQVNIGPELLHALEQPLLLLLAAARWLSYEAARIYRRVFDDIHSELVGNNGSSIVNATEFWMKADAILYQDTARIAGILKPMFQKRWADILRIESDQRRVHYRSADLRPCVLEAFKAPRPGWTFARYHSPDVMIAASGPEAIKRGDYQFVIGEIHVGINTLLATLFLAQHPSPEKIYQAVEWDLPEPRIMPLPPKRWPGLTARTSAGFVSRRWHRLEFSHDSCGVPKSQALPIGSLIVEKCGSRLVVRTRDGRVRYDVIEAFGELLSGLIMNFFDILPPTDHTPRVTIDRLVVCRESWRFSPAEMKFAFEKEETAQFASARAWMHDRGLPRFLFAKVPVEAKPFYVDFDSPIYVSIMAKAIRRTEQSGHLDQVITLAEMVPTHDQSWLPDIEGQRYTSELRIVAVDLAR